MEKPIRFGLIGAGGVGALHLAAIRRLEAFGEVKVAAIAEPSLDCRLASRGRGLVDPVTPWHERYQDLLEGGHDLDVVSIATPIPFHFEMARDAMLRGLFVHLEKPPVPLIQQLNHLLALNGSGQVSVGFQFIGSRCLRALKKLVVDGTLGTLRSIRATGCWPRLDTYYDRAPWAGRMVMEGRPVFDGPVTNALAHLVHNIMHLASPGVHGFAAPGEVAGELYRARPIESYDCACLRGTFPDGIGFSLAVAHASRSVLPFQLRVEGTRGWARLSEDGDRLETSDGLVIHQPETTQELINRCYERLTLRILNRGARVATRLEDTVPYVGTTNAMYLSSGGVHDIEETHLERFERDGSRGYHIAGICEAMDRVMETGCLLSELDIPWATANPAMVRLDSFNHLELEARPEAVPVGEKLAMI